MRKFDKEEGETNPSPPHRSPPSSKPTISTVVKTHTDFDLNFSEVLNQIAFQILNMQASNLSERARGLESEESREHMRKREGRERKEEK